MVKRFQVVTDHHSLKYLMTQPNLSKRQAWWVEFLAEFDFEIVHRPGKSNVVVDALSRLNCSALKTYSAFHCVGIPSDGELGPRMIRCGTLDGYWE